MKFLAMLKHSRLGASKVFWKSTNLLMYGGPNTGKTSMLKRLEEFSGLKFHFMNARAGDFSGYTVDASSLVFDDVMGSGKGTTVRMRLLLKILGSEGFCGDVKYGKLLSVKRALPCAILTNFPNAIVKREPLTARLYGMFVSPMACS